MSTALLSTSALQRALARQETVATHGTAALKNHCGKNMKMISIVILLVGHLIQLSPLINSGDLLLTLGLVQSMQLIDGDVIT